MYNNPYQQPNHSAPGVYPTTASGDPPMHQARMTPLSATDWVYYQPPAGAGAPYYYNRVTRQTQWTLPPGVPPPFPTAPVAPVAPPPSVWVEYRSPQGIPYYFNTQTKESTWVKPAEMTASAASNAAPVDPNTAATAAPANTTATATVATPTVDKEALRREAERKRREAEERARQRRAEEEARRVAEAERRRKEKEERERERKRIEEERRKAEEQRRRETLLARAGVSVAQVGASGDAEEGFLALLREKRIDPSQEWSTVLPLVVLDPRYIAVKSLARKKELFASYKEDYAKQLALGARAAEDTALASAHVWVQEGLDAVNETARYVFPRTETTAPREDAPQWEHDVCALLRDLRHPRYRFEQLGARLAEARRSCMGLGEPLLQAVERRLREDGASATVARDAAMDAVQVAWTVEEPLCLVRAREGAAARRQWCYAVCERVILDGCPPHSLLRTALGKDWGDIETWCARFKPGTAQHTASSQMQEPSHDSSFTREELLTAWESAWTHTDVDAYWFDASLSLGVLTDELMARAPAWLPLEHAEASAVASLARARIGAAEAALAEELRSSRAEAASAATATISALFTMCYPDEGAVETHAPLLTGPWEAEGASLAPYEVVTRVLPKARRTLVAILAARLANMRALGEFSLAAAPAPTSSLGLAFGLPAPLTLLGDRLFAAANHTVDVPQACAAITASTVSAAAGLPRWPAGLDAPTLSSEAMEALQAADAALTRLAQLTLCPPPTFAPSYLRAWTASRARAVAVLDKVEGDAALQLALYRVDARELRAWLERGDAVEYARSFSRYALLLDDALCAWANAQADRAAVARQELQTRLASSGSAAVGLLWRASDVVAFIDGNPNVGVSWLCACSQKEERVLAALGEADREATARVELASSMREYVGKGWLAAAARKAAVERVNAPVEEIGSGTSDQTLVVVPVGGASVSVPLDAVLPYALGLEKLRWTWRARVMKYRELMSDTRTGVDETNAAVATALGGMTDVLTSFNITPMESADGNDIVDACDPYEVLLSENNLGSERKEYYYYVLRELLVAALELEHTLGEDTANRKRKASDEHDDISTEKDSVLSHEADKRRRGE